MKLPFFLVDQSDKRNVYLAAALAEEGYEVVCCDSDTICSAQPKGAHCALVLSPAKPVTESIAASAPPESYIFGGKATPKALELIAKKEIAYVSFLDDEIFTMLAMENTPATIRDMEVLLLGYGRVAKCVNQVFTALGAKVTVLARNVKDIAAAGVFAHAAHDFDYLQHGGIAADVVINTVPHLVLGKSELRHLKQEAYIIDLASKPGGVDFEAAQALGIRTEHALGLPGRVAPKSAGDYMKRVILRTLAHSERIDNNG